MTFLAPQCLPRALCGRSHTANWKSEKKDRRQDDQQVCDRRDRGHRDSTAQPDWGRESMERSVTAVFKSWRAARGRGSGLSQTVPRLGGWGGRRVQVPLGGEEHVASD